MISKKKNRKSIKKGGAFLAAVTSGMSPLIIPIVAAGVGYGMYKIFVRVNVPQVVPSFEDLPPAAQQEILDNLDEENKRLIAEAEEIAQVLANPIVHFDENELLAELELMNTTDYKQDGGSQGLLAALSNPWALGGTLVIVVVGGLVFQFYRPTVNEEGNMEQVPSEEVVHETPEEALERLQRAINHLKQQKELTKVRLQNAITKGNERTIAKYKQHYKQLCGQITNLEGLHNAILTKKKNDEELMKMSPENRAKVLKLAQEKKLKRHD